MELFSVFVTGANRGIGLELVKQLVRLPRPPRLLFATYRSFSSVKELKAIKDRTKSTQILLIKLDVTKTNEIQAARKITEDMVGENGLTLLINNSGVCEKQSFPKVTPENLEYHYKINAIAPVMVLQEFLPLLQKAAARIANQEMSVSRAAVFNISSIWSSITKAGIEYLSDLDFPAYKMSKAALNMAMRVISANIKDQGILVMMMCPGGVRTDMGTDAAALSPEESIAAMLKTLPALNESHHGKLMDRFGNFYPF